MTVNARVAELVDARDSKSRSARSVGSIPSTGTNAFAENVPPKKRESNRVSATGRPAGSRLPRASSDVAHNKTVLAPQQPKFPSG